MASDRIEHTIMTYNTTKDNGINNGKDVRYLTDDWLCPEIIGRKEVRKDLDRCFTSQLIGEKGVPRAIYIYGGTGSGKTFVIRKMIDDNFNDIKRHIPTFEAIYINLQREQIPSYYYALFKINIYLEKFLPLNVPGFGFLEKIPTKGWTAGTHLDFMKKIIKLKKLCLIVIVDEIDRLVYYEKKYDFLTMFSTLYLEYQNKLFTGICPIFISNKISLLKHAPDDLPDRIPCKLHFKPYDKIDLINILKTTAKYALDDDQYNDKIISQVASEINDETKSARAAKLLFYHTVIEKNIEKAREKTDMDLIREEIKTYSFHQQLALLAILKRHKRIERMADSPNRNRYKRTDKLPTMMSAWEDYKGICVKWGEDKKSYRTFHRLIEPMVKNGILSVDRQSHGHTRGMANLLYLGEDYATIAPILTEIMG